MNRNKGRCDFFKIWLLSETKKGELFVDLTRTDCEHQQSREHFIDVHGHLWDKHSESMLLKIGKKNKIGKRKGN